MPPQIDESICDGCGICVLICPDDVFYGSKSSSIPIISYPGECWHCNSCVLDCPKDAIHLEIPLPMKFGWDIEAWMKSH